MESASPNVVAGFPEMWQPVYEKYKDFFELAIPLQSMAIDMIYTPVKGKVPQTVRRMMFAAANSMGALLTLALNGYGHDAMKVARSIFEIELNILWLKKYPEEVDDFLDYNIIQQKQLYDILDDDQKQGVPDERFKHMMDQYAAILPRFATRNDKTRPRNEGCRVSLYERARSGGRIDLYRTFYREASSLHHVDIGGLIAQLDDEMKVELAPTWGYLDKAIYCGIGSFVRCLNDFDEIAQLGYKDRLENGPNEDYVKAMKNL